MDGCDLAPSGPIRLERQDNALIQRLDVSGSVWTPHGLASIYCLDSKNVTVREVRIRHEQDGSGILFVRCPGIRIERVAVVARVSALPNDRCQHPWKDCDNIHGWNSDHISMSDIHVTGGASGIELHDCTHAHLQRVVAFELSGPFPRGQAVQFSRSPHSTLRHFYIKNTPYGSWVEDLVSVWQSANVSVVDGLIDGSNSPNGVCHAPPKHVGIPCFSQHAHTLAHR